MVGAWKEVAKMEQQMFMEIFGTVNWDVFLPRERKLLEDKVGMVTFGPPDVEYNVLQVDHIKTVTDAIIQNGRPYDTGASATWTSVVMVVVQPQEGAYYCHPVFRVPQGQGHAFVDCLGRFYLTWEEFLKDNKLPEDSDICYPLDGVYRWTPGGHVRLQFARTKSRILLKVADIGSNVLAVGSLGVAGLAALPMVSVAAPVVAGAAVVSAVCGVYDAARAAFDQFDRADHGQNIGVGSVQSVSNWFSIGMGLFGVSSAYKVCKVVQSKEVLEMGAKLSIAGRSTGSLRNPGGGIPQEMYRDARLKAVPLRHLSWYALMFGHVVADPEYAADFLVSPRGTEGILTLRSACVTVSSRGESLRSLEFLGLEEGKVPDVCKRGVSSLFRGIFSSPDLDVQGFGGIADCLKRVLERASQLYANFTVDWSAAVDYFSKYNLTTFFELSIKISMMWEWSKTGATLGVLFMIYRCLRTVVQMAQTEVPSLRNVTRDSILEAASVIMAGSGDFCERFCRLCTEYLLPKLGELALVAGAHFVRGRLTSAPLAGSSCPSEGAASPKPGSSNYPPPSEGLVLLAAGDCVGKFLDGSKAKVAYTGGGEIFVIITDPNIRVKVVQVEQSENGGGDLVASVVR